MPPPPPPPLLGRVQVSADSERNPNRRRRGRKGNWSGAFLEKPQWLPRPLCLETADQELRLLGLVETPSRLPFPACTMSVPGNGSALCPNGSRWVMEVFNECAQDAWDVASVVLGLVSILCFAGASFPQFYLSCKTGMMDQALSFYFLLGWLGGDSLNLIGSFLADQLPLQVYTAIYYVLADLLMISLYVYYKIKNQNRTMSASINAVFASLLLVGSVSAFSSLDGPDVPRGSVDPVAFKGRALLSLPEAPPGWEPFTRKEIIGFVIGSVSAVLYLGSRLPQIYTNFMRKSTTGISYSLFALVILGNSLYGASVLTKNPNPGQSEGNYIVHHLPWLVGSLGVLSLDIVISFQFLAYRQGRPLSQRDEEEALLRGEENRRT